MSIVVVNFTRNFLVIRGKRFISSDVKQIKKILIANRGEIACRIIKTAQKLGIKTVAIYSDADKNALHVEMADEAFNIGPPPVSQSYLLADKIIEIAKISKSNAIHPGYGFLSENLEFAYNCQKNNVIFIGPPASAIRDMGIKSTSKMIMSKADVPIIKGYHGDDQSIETLKLEAERIGYPIMIKAVRGGGGKGMRIVQHAEDFETALESAKTESQKAFGDSIVLLEQFIDQPRHVEVQIFGDLYGNFVHLFERDCSVQRRHQKIIEEAPAPHLPEDIRRSLGVAAIKAAKAVGYVGAGTVEFILNRKNFSFYFMEMNTRLQVEHPITEMITGVDLVEWQIKIASGEKLPLKQDEIKMNGHSFESRIYAEDPKGGFLPGSGTLLFLNTPQPSKDCRIETGVREGDEVSVHYDPMIAKLVVWGKNRAEALLKMQSKLLEYNIAGLETNVNFLLELTRNREFLCGNVHTNFIRDNEKSLFRDEILDDLTCVQAALLIILKEKQEYSRGTSRLRDDFNPFVLESSYRINHNLIREIKIKYNNKEYTVKLRYDGPNVYSISLNNGKIWYQADGKLNGTQKKVKCTINGEKTSFNGFFNNDIVAVFNHKGKSEFSLEKPKFLNQSINEMLNGGLGDGGGHCISPMPGVLDKILVNVGDKVKKGDSLFVLIAMKMENIVKSTRDAIVDKIYYKAGDTVAKDVVIVKLKDIE